MTEYVTVPKEPTEAMLDAFWHGEGESREMRARMHVRGKRVWRAFLEAAPLATAPQVSAEDKSEAALWKAHDEMEASQVSEMREKVARIVDPAAWDLLDSAGPEHAAFVGLTTDRSLAKADAILAILNTSREGGV